MFRDLKQRNLAKKILSNKYSLEDKCNLVCKADLGHKRAYEAVCSFMKEQINNRVKWSSFLSSYGINNITMNEALKEEGRPQAHMSLSAILLRSMIANREIISDYCGAMDHNRRDNFINKLIKFTNVNCDKELHTLIEFAKVSEFSTFIPTVARSIPTSSKHKLIRLIPATSSPESLKLVLHKINKNSEKPNTKINLALVSALEDIDKNIDEEKQEEFADIAFKEFMKHEDSPYFSYSLVYLKQSSNDSVKSRARLYDIISHDTNTFNQDDIDFISRVITSDKYSNTFKNHAMLSFKNMEEDRINHTVSKIVLNISDGKKPDTITLNA